MKIYLKAVGLFLAILTVLVIDPYLISAKDDALVALGVILTFIAFPAIYYAGVGIVKDVTKLIGGINEH